jgi:hypothetical protein
MSLQCLLALKVVFVAVHKLGCCTILDCWQGVNARHKLITTSYAWNALSLNINFSPVNKNDYDGLDFLFIAYKSYLSFHKFFVVANVKVITLKKSGSQEVLI